MIEIIYKKFDYQNEIDSYLQKVQFTLSYYLGILTDCQVQIGVIMVN